MDATYGDFISIRISSLYFVEATVGLSTIFEYTNKSTNKFNQFLFTKEKGGYI